MSDKPLATSFGAAAATYEQGRPEYPAEAVSWMLGPAARDGKPLTVADVGAGTGKLTRALVSLGAQVVAIDPDPGMLAQLREAVPGIPTLEGTAEHLPLADGAVDAVVVGQAWHWVEPVAGCAEIGRVTGAGGVLGLIWNVRDGSVPWVSRLGEIMRGSHAEQMLDAGEPPTAAPFETPERRQWRWSRPMTRELLTAMVHSRSYVIAADEAERARIDEAIATLLDEIGAVGESTVELPYVTTAYRSVRAG